MILKSKDAPSMFLGFEHADGCRPHLESKEAEKEKLGFEFKVPVLAPWSGPRSAAFGANPEWPSATARVTAPSAPSLSTSEHHEDMYQPSHPASSFSFVHLLSQYTTV